ncbi:TatD family hydrolase [Candidatus Woesearchaeota archaeon]|nr:TatD family hydrolase [Candidatus Woesearchaeota archaeon]
MLIDVHAHLQYKDFENDLDDVIKRAEEVGVKAIIVNGLTKEDNKKVLELSKKYDVIKVALGIHPNEVKSTSDKDFEEIFSFIRENKDNIIAIGECGLDYYHDKDEGILKRQKEVFIKFLKLAEELNKPIIIHNRKAERDVIDILKNYKVKALLHFFSGNMKLAKQAEEIGCYFSIPVSIIRSEHFKTLVNKVSISKILTETDSPYGNPEVGRNEPSYVKKTIKEISVIKDISLKDTENIVYQNFQALFS